METPEEKKAGTPPAEVDRREDLSVSAPALEVSQQPGFKVLEEEPKRGGSKLVWTALLVVIAILAGYYFGFFR